MPGGEVATLPPHHSVSQQHFDDLAAGGGTAESIGLLANGGRSRRMLLLRAVLDAAREKDACGPLPDVDMAWRMLIDLQNRAPAEFDDVLMQPQTGMWMAHSLRRLQRPEPGPIPLWVDVGYVFNVVLAMAARAGIDMHIMVPHHGGAVMVPTFGLAQLAEDLPFGVAEAVVASGHMRVSTQLNSVEVRLQGTSDSDGWWVLRRLRCRADGLEFAIWLDDIDPYRAIGEPVPPDRLSNAQVLRWRRLLDGAYAILVHDDPVLAAAMSVGVASVVPLPPTGNNSVRSASSGDSSGSALISIPPDPTTLAVTLVHEFQHIKLGGLLHLLTLCEEDDSRRCYAPWRDDPRPIRGLLQGVYAFLGITEFWRVRRKACLAAGERALAEFEFALWRKQTQDALRTLRSDASLTDLGRRFADGMAARMRSWPSELVAPQIAVAAEAAAHDHRTEWRIRHIRPDPGYITQLAADLKRGLPARIGAFGFCIVPDGAGVWSHQRTALTRLRFIAPEEFCGLSRSAAAGEAQLAGDVALASGDYLRAADEYGKLLTGDPGQPDAWTGLVLALCLQDATARPLLAHPELLPALYRELRAGPGEPDPGAVARWLCGES